MAVTRIKRALALILTLSVIVLGACGAAEDPAKERMLALYGQNLPVEGDYDTSLSAVCSNGIFVGTEKNGVISFKGVPYAEPPVGELRWRDPVPAKDGDSVYQAYYFGPSPIQSEWPSEVGSYYPQSEDCLTLNVWTNTRGPAEGKTVMVFIHGGSYGWGATSDPIYDGQNLVEKYPDIVLVSVEYRLGIFGFIDFSSVPGGEDYPTAGNLGLLDQICALGWIRKNIAAFGGDPDNVTVFGESAGAGSVSLLPLMDGSEGLFRRIIAESGSVALTYSREECRNLTQLLLDKSGCCSMDELTALMEDELRALNEELNDYNNFPERDGVVLPEDLYAAYAGGAAGAFDMLIGTNADEVRYWIKEMGYYLNGVGGMFLFEHGLPVMFENNLRRLSDGEKALVGEFLASTDGRKVWRLTEFYNEMLFRVPAMKQAELHSDNGNRVFTYFWTAPGADPTVGACHAIELAYVFNNPEVDIYTGGAYDCGLADTVQDMWVNFARFGDPGVDGLSWEQYDSRTRMTMVFGDGAHMEADIKADGRSLLEPLLGHFFNGCYSQLDLMVPQTLRIAAQALAVILIAVAAVVAPILIVGKKKRRAAASR